MQAIFFYSSFIIDIVLFTKTSRLSLVKEVGFSSKNLLDYFQVLLKE